MVQGSSATGEKYKPSGTAPFAGPFTFDFDIDTPDIEHKGRREDNQPDKRTQQHKFAYGKVDPHQAGHEGGKIGGQAGGLAGGGAGGLGGGRGPGKYQEDPEFEEYVEE
ncbi:hypothetical protein BDV18DRAFT_155657 [Aspergillus unguis]